MPDPFMPDVVVEIAFDSGYTTPDASRTWTDVSTYVELADRIAIGVGRQDERSTADANSLTLTLDNKDGRFTAGRSASPYYPNVKIGRPIRVTVTPPGGSASRRFVGFIDEWPVEWDGTDAYAKATIRAASRLARLGLSAKLRSMVEQEILQDAPVVYYTLGEPAGASSAVDGSGNTGPQLAAYPGYVTFGNATGPPTDGLTAAEITNTSRYTLDASAAVLPPGTAAWSVEVFFSSSSALGGHIIGLGQILGSQPAPEILFLSGKLRGQVGASTVTSVDTYWDGALHHAAITYAAGTLTLYADGVSLGTVAVAETPEFPTFGIAEGFEGVVAHGAVYDQALSEARIAAHATAGFTGHAAERTDQRLLRILGWAGVAATEVTTQTGVETMTYQLTSGQTVVDALRDVESTEGGVLFDGRDGRVTFHNRSRRYLATPAATLNMGAQHVEADFAPKLDRSALANDVTVENPTTGQQVRLTDAESVDEYGVATGSARSVATSSDALLQKASWLVASYAEPRNRVPSLTVDVLAHQGLTPSAQTLLGLTVGDLLAVTNAPTQADTTNQSYFVEGYTETIGPESYSITFNLSPTYPTLNAFVLDSATRGVLDTGILAH